MRTRIDRVQRKTFDRGASHGRCWTGLEWPGVLSPRCLGGFKSTRSTRTGLVHKVGRNLPSKVGVHHAGRQRLLSIASLPTTTILVDDFRTDTEDLSLHLSDLPRLTIPKGLSEWEGGRAACREQDRCRVVRRTVHCLLQAPSVLARSERAAF